jgi:formylglycine-generating enzyme required for sulfatase activity
MLFRNQTPLLTQYRRDMILIPEGAFLRGGDEGDEKPTKKIMLSAYRIGKTPVTVALYEEFCQATGRTMPEPPVFNSKFEKKDHPIVNVSWDDAKALADWAKLTLPTEAQWEKAARGTEGRLYPWGKAKPAKGLGHFPLWLMPSKDLLNLPRTGTAPVGSFPKGASPYGCLDMAGNVWEWCADWYSGHYYREAPSKNPTGPLLAAAERHPLGPFRVVRGGCWGDITDEFQCSNRGWDPPKKKSDSTGIRLAAPAR